MSIETEVFLELVEYPVPPAVGPPSDSVLDCKRRAASVSSVPSDVANKLENVMTTGLPLRIFGTDCLEFSVLSTCCHFAQTVALQRNTCKRT